MKVDMRADMEAKTNQTGGYGLPARDRCARPCVGGGYGRRQRGAAALIATLILAIIAALSVLVVNTATVKEQQLSGNDIRSKEVYAAAVGAMEFGAKQLQDIYLKRVDPPPAWSDWSVKAGGWGQAGATATAAPFANAVDATNTIYQGADNYTTSVTYELLTNEDANPAVVEITATAVAQGDSHVQKIIRQKFLIAEVGTVALTDGPPLVIENCITDTGIVGGPDISSDGLHIGSVRVSGPPGTIDACLDPGHFDGFDENGNPKAVETGGLDGSTAGADLFQILFGMDTGTFKALARVNPEYYIYVDASYNGSSREAAANAKWGGDMFNSNTWHGNVGSNSTNADGEYDDTVILYFDSSVDCPPINGTTTVYGIVFYDTTNCTDPGGGGGIIYGTLAFTGNLEHFNANTEIHGVSIANHGETEKADRVVHILPQTWRDF